MLSRTKRWLIVVTSCITVSLNGCALKCWNSYDCPDAPAYCEQLIADYADRGLSIEEPEPNSCEDGSELSEIPISPDHKDIGSSYWDLSLEETVEIALSNSQVMRDLGGVLRGTDSLVTVFDPAIAYTDGRFGEEAALSAFDASFGASAYFEQNDFGVNNNTVGVGGLFKQDFHNYEVNLTKQSATGGVFTLRNVTEYDNNNQTSTNLTGYGHSWDTYVDAELRQPLMQGAGVLFNRIAGPDSEPGYINGVLIARTRTDISMADFEIAVRNLVSDAENAYWDLYFSYRDLDAKIEARDNALRVWQLIQNNLEFQAGDASATNEGQAREQYYRFEAEVINSLHGRLVERTRTNNGSLGGTFNNAGGVRVAERRLRVILGLPINAEALLRPSDEPSVAATKFDWNSIALEAIARRPEIRRQKWVVKQKELELLANKNFLKPSLDLVARYRARGFGNDLTDYGNSPNDNAWGSLASGEFQEYQMGFEFEMPLGFRRAHAAVRNSELQISRAKAILKEQENFIMYGLSNTYGDIDRAYKVMQAQFNRREAAYGQQNAVEVIYNQGKVPLDLLLESQRRVIDANVLFYQARVDYALAIKNVHFEKGSLLEYYNIRMAEGAWPQKAYNDAVARDLNKRRAHNNYIINDAVIGQPKKVTSTLDLSDAQVPQPAAAEAVDLGPVSVPNPLRESPELETVRPVNHTLPVPSSPAPSMAPVIQAPIIYASEVEIGSGQFDFSGNTNEPKSVWLH